MFTNPHLMYCTTTTSGSILFLNSTDSRFLHSIVTTHPPLSASGSCIYNLGLSTQKQSLIVLIATPTQTPLIIHLPSSGGDQKSPTQCQVTPIRQTNSTNVSEKHITNCHQRKHKSQKRDLVRKFQSKAWTKEEGDSQHLYYGTVQLNSH